MHSTRNITHIKGYSHSERQQIIDDICARTFLFLRDSAEAMGIATADIVAEHMLGMALVMSQVEGCDHTQALLQHIGTCIDND